MRSASSGTAPPARYPRFKAGVFALLAANAAVFSVSGTLSESLDSVAWLTLLALFEIETAHGERVRARHATALVRGLRIVAAAAVAAAAARYVQERAWLDAANAWLWIAVVALLEWEVRFPHVAQRCRGPVAAVAITLYGALALLVPLWAWRGEWFDAYDALLWLVAFATIEMNVLRPARAAPVSG